MGENGGGINKKSLANKHYARTQFRILERKITHT